VNVLFQFVPGPNDPLLAISTSAALNNTGATQLHWLQVLHATDNLGLNRTVVDGMNPPWYDTRGQAGIGTLGGSGSWLGDRPTAFENGPNNPDPRNHPPGDPGEPVDPYKYSIEFQTYLAVDNLVTVNSNTVHTVTLYGGWDWGYRYEASDIQGVSTPDSSSFLADCSVILGMFGYHWLQRRRRVNQSR
jgi:hypothetical protein